MLGTVQEHPSKTNSSVIPVQIPSSEDVLKMKTDCGMEPPRWTNVTTYKQQKKLLYPVNIARNTARRAAQTYFVFASDVELYPSINFIPGKQHCFHYDFTFLIAFGSFFV